MEIVKAKKIILLLGDIISLFTSLPVALVLAYGNDFYLKILAVHLAPFLVIYFFILISFYIIGLYDTRLFKSTTSTISSIIAIHGGGLVFGMLFFYLTAESWGLTPKTNLALIMAAGTIFVSVWRMLFQRLLSNRLAINVAIAGINQHAKELADIISAKPYTGYHLSAFISTAPLLNKTAEVCGDTAIFGANKDIVGNLVAAKIDTVITAENPHLNPALAQVFYECIPHRIQFLDLAQSYELLTGRIPISYINQTWFLENINEQKKAFYAKIKRVLDIMASATILLATIPFWPIIALAIKWESAGSVLYTQERVGQNKKLFSLLKFRSMIKDAEQGKAVWAQEKDPRITKIGAILRKIHFDELPQMINIMRGDLSLVGPRPERIEFVRELENQIPHYHIRHIIKPGFTGWAQVNFRYARTPMDTYEKFQYDLYYLKNRSFILDIAIILKTINLFFKKG